MMLLPIQPSYRILGASVLTIFTIASAYFASHQAIWIDETTQLFGLELPFVTQLAWLSGAIDVESGVPPDRSMPLSYWLGGIWAAVLGSGEMQMRLFGVVCTLSAAPGMWMAGRRVGGPKGALFALAAVYLAPGVIVQAVEIRSYPLFFALSAWTVWAYLEVLERTPASLRHLVLLVVFMTLASYTHFFGFLMAGCLGLTLIAFFLLEKRPITPLLLAALAMLCLSIGSLPFVMGAVSVTGESIGSPPSQSVAEAVLSLARLIIRLFLHGSAMAVVPAAVLGIICLVALGVCALVEARYYGRTSRGTYLLVPLLFALPILLALKFVVGGFNVMAPHYNIWMVPFAVVFLAAAFNGPARRWSVIPAITLVISSLISGATLLLQPTLYSHGPGEWIAGMINSPGDTLVIHDAQGAWAQAYFPVYYLKQGRVTQILYGGNEGEKLIKPGGIESLPEDFHPSAFKEIILVRTRTMTSKELADMTAVESGCGLSPMPLPIWLGSSPSENSTYCALAGAIVTKVRLE